ncbi:hypothetical protein BH20ACT24_BH20ACT24_19950 [soil metagenome]
MEASVRVAASDGSESYIGVDMRHSPGFTDARDASPVD